jgi:cellulose synthase/poly-beta-1,6-N-acetylglucosamine synthase-like glycosyltransferase
LWRLTVSRSLKVMGTQIVKGRVGALQQIQVEGANTQYTAIRDKEKLSDITSLPLDLSSVVGVSQAQKNFFNRTMAVLGVSGLILPELLFWGFSYAFWALFAAFVLWRFILLLSGLWVFGTRRDPLKGLDSHNLPTYTVMVAVYKEAPVMPQLARAMGKLNWPMDKLDIIILLEADDEVTLQAALKAGFPAGTRLLILPDGIPKTKPRALNYGLRRARGEFVCIYDAEDRPHPDQLKEAFAVFQKSDARLACVQAPLYGTGANRSLISAHWCLEYAVHFQYLIPALSALKAPIPLGGTSNHFRASRLRDAGGWDAWNVTEDADLGLRFARLGWRIGIIKRGTWEEAPRAFSVWYKQRSRWIKGFMQTWFVLMRHPITVLRQMGWWKFTALQLTLGSAILAPIVHGPFFLFVLLCILSPELSVGRTGWTLMIAGYCVTLIGDLGAPGVPLHGRIRAALTRPLYWPLHSLAAMLAVYELVVRPHYWAKTPHEASEEDPSACLTG